MTSPPVPLPPPSVHCRSSYQVDREKEKELELIKQQYLGGDKHKKRIMKVSG